MLLPRILIFLCGAVLSMGETLLQKEKKLILEDPDCSQVKKYCDSNNVNSDTSSDMEVLECLQSLSQVQLANLKPKCQHVIWTSTKALISNDKVHEILEPHCKKDLPELKCNLEKDKFYLRCIVDNKDNIREEGCYKIVDRLENVVFQDFRLIPSFLKECEYDINRLECGRLDTYSLSQAQTVVCLQMKIQNISSSCKKELFSLAEVQANNIKLDRQLYMACKEDHLKFCPQLIAGGGRVFACLMQQDQTKLSALCVANLFRRQRLIAQDYKISKGLMRACREDIKHTHCRRQTSNDKTIRLAQILLCLEGVQKNGSKLDHDCEKEMIAHRKLLLDDYRLSPEIVSDCKLEIKTLCSGMEVGGKTIHCLMENARLTKHPKRKISDTCMRALETLIKETDAGENWKVDPVLYQACSPLVQTLCRNVEGGDARVMSCLMDNIGNEYMLDECEDALMQIQYFVARDFKLDPQLYRACKEHAVSVCHASKTWAVEGSPSYDNQVLPCLYRYAYLEDNKKLQLGKNCLQEIKRVMRQRAQSVDLHPEIEEPCLDDLSELCFDKTRKGEEMVCLQKNLDNLSELCQKAVESLTEIEGRNVELNHYIVSHCRREMKQLCEFELKKDEGDIMECLISHKNDPVIKEKPACRASIEHFQIISLKNYKFTYKFKIACKKHAMRFCVNARTKTEVITCLSERITNDTIRGEKSVVPKECRQQLKSQLFQQRENIDFDPKLKAACEKDIEAYCRDIEHGNAQVLECLQSVFKKLSDKCEKELFKIKKQEISDNSVDYALMTMCSDTINIFCPHHERDDVLECLKKNKDERGFNKKCRMIVLHRMAEQDSNYNLNPSLQENCKNDMNKFCKKVAQDKHDRSFVNNTMDCLKRAFKDFKLSDKCEKEMAHILREQALDINLNPLLRAVCGTELQTICQVGEHENIEECLKNALLARKIPTPVCQNEVANMIEESQADIQVDPLLQQACALDLIKFCSEVPQGNGRHIRCLKEITSKKLSVSCRDMLSKRLQMYENAAMHAAPEDLHELYYQVVGSPSKHYFFLMIFMMIGSIFVVGIFCGRVSRRHMLIKNK